MQEISSKIDFFSSQNGELDILKPSQKTQKML
jgi:hypothetical protein